MTMRGMSRTGAESANFGFLGQHDAQLVRLGALAERYFRDDPNTCLIILRQFGEVLAQLAAAKAGAEAENNDCCKPRIEAVYGSTRCSRGVISSKPIAPFQ